jgi:long-chain acyl-CoA synthetase
MSRLVIIGGGDVGIPGPYQIEAVKTYVVLHQGETSAPEEMQTYCRDKLVAYKIPKHVEFRTELPKTLVGKILKRVLVEKEIKKQKAAGAAQIK